MEEFTYIRCLSEYSRYIEREFLPDNGEIDLKKIGDKTFEASLLITSVDILKKNLASVIAFLRAKASENWIRPIWYKLNIDDNIGNDNVGIGFLNLKGDWLKFIITYLQEDLAAEGGDCLILLFDIKFRWAVKFELLPYENRIKVERYETSGG